MSDEDSGAHAGLDEQVPIRVCASNNRISGQRIIGVVALTLIEVADTRPGGTEKVGTTEGLTGV